MTSPTRFRSRKMSSDGDSDGASEFNGLNHSLYVRVNNAVTVPKTRLETTVSCVKHGLIYWPKPSDSRRSEQMPGIKNLKNNINVNVFIIVLFW